MNQLRYISIRFDEQPTMQPLSQNQLKKDFSTNNTVYRGKGRYYQHYLYGYFPKPSPCCTVIGVDMSPGGYSILERDIDDCFLIFAIRGRGTLNGKEFRAGQFFALSSHYVSTLVSDPRDPWVICWISWRGDIAEEILRVFSKFQSGVFYPFQNAEALFQLFRSFLYCDHAHADDRALLQAFSCCVLSMFDMQPFPAEEAEASAASLRIRSYVEEAKELLSTQFATISIHELSRQLHLDRKYLCRIFHAMTGVTPQSYLIDVRMQNSAFLLTETDFSLEEIASKCGYSSYNCFLQAFKKKSSVTPPEYRKSAKL